MSSSAAGAATKTTPLIKRAAIAQLRSTSNKYRNLVDIAKCAGWAKREGACMLFLPECLGFIGSSSEDTLNNAEYIMDVNDDDDIQSQSCKSNPHQESLYQALQDTISSHSKMTGYEAQHETVHGENIQNSNVSIIHGLQTIAQESGLWISAGGIHEAGAPPLTTSSTSHNASSYSSSPNRPRVYNTHIILNSTGKIQSKYRKIHLFDVSIPSQNLHLRESATTAPGTKLVVCDSPLGTLGLSTCYDLRFGEMYLELVRGGADILLVPSAFTVPTGRAHWHSLLRARAIEHQCFVLAAAQFGRHNEKRESYGHSIAIDPWGGILEDAGGCDGPGTTLRNDDDGQVSLSSSVPSIIVCDIDREKIQLARERMPIQAHRDSSKFSWDGL